MSRKPSSMGIAGVEPRHGECYWGTTTLSQGHGGAPATVEVLGLPAGGRTVGVATIGGP
jgi:hypothetical protein